jgi:hypothetical protein
LAGFTEFSAYTPEISSIAENAGLSGDYRCMADNCASPAENIFDSNSERYLGENCVVIHAGEMLDEAGSFYDGSDWNEFDGLGGGPDWGGRRLGIAYGGAGEWLTYKVSVPKSGVYGIYSLTATDAESGCSLYIDGVKVADKIPLNINYTGVSNNVWEECRDTYLAEAYFEAGREYTVKYEYNYGYWNFDSLVFMPRPEETLLAEESFDYPITEQAVPFGDYPSAGESRVDGGFGWDGEWSSVPPGAAGFPAAFPSGSGKIPGLYKWEDGKTVAFSFSNNQLYRALQSPVDLKRDAVIRVSYDIMSQYASRSGFVFGNVFIGNTDYNAVKMKPAIGINDSYTLGRNLLDTGNSHWYTYVAEFVIRACARDEVRIKAFPAGSGEPPAWDAQTGTELGSAPISRAAFEIAASSYFRNLKITQDCIINNAELIMQNYGGALRAH